MTSTQGIHHYQSLNSAVQRDVRTSSTSESINLTPDVIQLRSAFHVDQAILGEENALVVIRFGSDDDILCQAQDHCLQKCAEKIKDTWAVFWKVDNRGDGKKGHVPDFNEMYELYDRVTVMFFYRNKHMMCDFQTGNNNKINWLLDNSDEMVDILEVIYNGARKGRGLVNSPKDYSTRHAY